MSMIEAFGFLIFSVGFRFYSSKRI